VTGAISKRVSEGEEREEFATAGFLSIVGLFSILTLGLVAFQSYVDAYVGYPATKYVILILFITLLWSIISSLLKGLHLVHIQGVLSPVKIGGRSLLQISAVAAGLSVAGLFLGYAAGFLLIIAIGAWFVIRRLDGVAKPQNQHFRSLFDYAKFAWLGSLQSRMFNYTDVLVLGFFVSQAMIGVYSIAWSISQFFILFSGSISTTLFPEMSEISTEQEPQAVSGLLEEAIAYAGLFLVPGLVGGALVGERLLRIYGEEFTQGATILVILILANLIMSYQNQLLNTLNAIDRPELSFRVNALFVVSNVVLNLVLIYFFGWLGAAVATALSVTISLILAYAMVESIINFSIPTFEIAKQWVSALIMGGVVYSGLWIENTYRLLQHNIATVLLLVGLGAAVYFLILLGISSTFRDTVNRNLPIDIL
jgi:O-antigen/teichoic acid export membrane protein